VLPARASAGATAAARGRPAPGGDERNRGYHDRNPQLQSPAQLHGGQPPFMLPVARVALTFIVKVYPLPLHGGGRSPGSYSESPVLSSLLNGHHGARARWLVGQETGPPAKADDPSQREGSVDPWRHRRVRPCRPAFSTLRGGFLVLHGPFVLLHRTFVPATTPPSASRRHCDPRTVRHRSRCKGRLVHQLPVPSGASGGLVHQRPTPSTVGGLGSVLP
jgi:hypothetical protein